jgi:hypothetical protein
MSETDRRQFLKGLLGKLALATGTIVLGSTSAPAAQKPSSKPQENETPPEDIQKRADQLAVEGPSAECAAEANEFLNGAFRNTPLGGFRNTPLGGFRNTPLGRFRNTPMGGFRNTPIGSFRNVPGGSFGNGGWPNGGWGGFHNGGWPNGGWMNYWW